MYPVFEGNVLTQRDVAGVLHVPERALEDWRLRRHGAPNLKLGHHARHELDDIVPRFRRHRAAFHLRPQSHFAAQL